MNVGNGTLQLIAQFVDARSGHEEGLLEFWLRVRLNLAKFELELSVGLPGRRFLVSRAPCKPVGKLLLWYPLTEHGRKDALQR